MNIGKLQQKLKDRKEMLALSVSKLIIGLARVGIIVTGLESGIQVLNRIRNSLGQIQNSGCSKFERDKRTASKIEGEVS